MTRGISGALAVWNLAAAILIPVSAEASPAGPSSDNGEAVRIIANARRIVNPEGIERLETVRIGGIDQWVSIRGRDRRNPVLLVIHGGPGYVEMPMSWWSANGWEDWFTVVEWDQRGAGKTYLINDPAAVGPTIDRPRMLADAEEMVRWLRQDLHKRKIFVLGHSWGSYLGLELASRHPDWLYAYIGVGQITNGPESERRGWAFAMASAEREHNAEAVKALESIAPYAAPGRPPALTDIYVQRKWLDHYGGVMAFRPENGAESDLAKLSPDYSAAERAHIWDGNDFSEQRLLAGVLSLDLTTIRRFDCPLILLEGRHDMNVNSAVAADWFATVRAPAKRWVWFDHSAHLPMTEEPGKFLVSLVDIARPFAESAGDIPRRLEPPAPKRERRAAAKSPE